ncbi:MAG: transposase [Candidatus Sulfotelmatobacter sp.]
MKLTVQVRLMPTGEQAIALRETMEAANAAADRLSEIAWKAQEFRRFPLHRLGYRAVRDEFPLSSQVVCLLTAKVADAYKLDRRVQRKFRPHGSIAYDLRILSVNVLPKSVSIWTVGGREKMSFVCGAREIALLAYPRGESDLIFRHKKWFLNITVEVPEEKEIEAIDALGVDMGIVEIAHDSDGKNYSGSTLNKVRHRSRSLRRKLQRKGTKSAKRMLKKLSRREANFARNTNHVISKSIVQNAKRTNRAIAIENLDGIRSRVRARRRQRTKLHSWAFAQLGSFLEYKAKLAGVPLVRIDPRDTSRRCGKCGHTEKANRKSQSVFSCKSCGYTANADFNGAGNIRLKGLALLGAGASNTPTRSDFGNRAEIITSAIPAL